MCWLESDVLQHIQLNQAAKIRSHNHQGPVMATPGMECQVLYSQHRNPPTPLAVLLLASDL